MMSATQEVDLVIVGGGIGGSSLGVVMARAGYSCVVLERTTAFPDRTRGEWLAPWGVLEARRIGVEADLRSARGHVLRRLVIYEPEISHAQAESDVLDLSRMVPDVEGAMTQRHPDACQALFGAAGKAGANCIRGVEDVSVVTSESIQRVTFKVEGSVREVRCRLVVAADGRQSAIRRQLDIELHTDEPHHLFSGLLVEDADGFPEDLQVIGSTDEVHYLVLPQGSGRIRLYLGFPFSDRHRYTGEVGVRNFLDAFETPSFPYARERRVRMSNLRFAGRVASKLNNEFGPEAVECRVRAKARMAEDPMLGLAQAVIMIGPEHVPEGLLGASTWEALFS